MGCVKASPVRGGGKISDFAGGVIRRGDDSSPGAGQRQVSTAPPPKGTSYGVAAHHLRGAPQEDFLRCCCAPPPGAVGTKRRRTSGRERSFGHESQRGCVAAFYGMHTGRSSGTPPLVKIRARHQCEPASTDTSRRRRQPHNKRKFQRTKRSLARLSSISFVVIRKIWPPEGVPL